MSASESEEMQQTQEINNTSRSDSEEVGNPEAGSGSEADEDVSSEESYSKESDSETKIKEDLVAKPPRKKPQPKPAELLGKDENGNQLYKGSGGGIYYISVTKSGNNRKNYLPTGKTKSEKPKDETLVEKQRRRAESEKSEPKKRKWSDLTSGPDEDVPVPKKRRRLTKKTTSLSADASQLFDVDVFPLDEPLTTAAIKPRRKRRSALEEA